MNRRTGNPGFTLIELMIVIVIVAILMTLVVVNLRSSFPDARNDERKTDIESIARGFERRYSDGNLRATGSNIQKGAYPSVSEVLHAQGDSVASFTPTQISGGYMSDLLPGVTRTILQPPQAPIDQRLLVVCSSNPSSCTAEDPANIDAILTSKVYVYEPIDADNKICNSGECIRFNLYYKTEKDNVTHKVRSIHQ